MNFLAELVVRGLIAIAGLPSNQEAYKESSPANLKNHTNSVINTTFKPPSCAPDLPSHPAHDADDAQYPVTTSVRTGEESSEARTKNEDSAAPNIHIPRFLTSTAKAREALRPFTLAWWQMVFASASNGIQSTSYRNLTDSGCSFDWSLGHRAHSGLVADGVGLHAIGQKAVNFYDAADQRNCDDYPVHRYSDLGIAIGRRQMGRERNETSASDASRKGLSLWSMTLAASPGELVHLP
ncbi:hypothetical protein C8R44DRAFT_738160 [Mycena epipterygia]|nr:hypothetical protein C8R44DRAFT_738160 [Mycena epipterygia]